ncbi:MAG TPA: MarR family transcriptional regulator [Methylomirabilota bacterium]|jgi:DNA-binding MarR family transcriptional regulator|nr:MarR family transcriptional regulator [Methylomirabilota bacterium]
MSKPCDATVLAWSRLMRAHRAALAAAEQALRAADLPPLEWYDVLWELERAGSLRPRDLQGRLLLAQYNLSRLLDRMADAGLVERRSCKEDGRGLVVAVSKEGVKLRRRMWPVYADAIQAAIGAKLGSADAAALAGLLARLTDAEPAARSARG